MSGDSALVGTASGLFGFFQMLFAAISAQAVGSLQDATPVPMAVCVLLAGSLSLLSIAVAMRSR